MDVMPKAFVKAIEVWELGVERMFAKICVISDGG